VTSLDLILIYLAYLLVPTFLVVLIALVLSLLGIKPPKPRNDGWFGPYQ
jgi:hypothetical protein